MARIAVVGNATRDINRAGLGSVRRPGGTLVYASLALAALGHDVVPIGTAPIRAYAWLRRSGLDVSRVQVALPGTQFLNQYDGARREQWARRGPARAMAPGADLDGFDAILLGPVLGEVPSTLELPKGVPALLDVQGTVRRLGPLNVWGWRPVSTATEDVRFARAEHVHGSIDEVSELTGENEPADAARVLGERTGATTIVTLGPQGAVAVQQGEPVHVRPPVVDVEDPTGAGDVFDAGYVHGLVEGADLRGCVAWGCAAAGTFLERTWPRRRPPIERFAALDEVKERFERIG